MDRLGPAVLCGDYPHWDFDDSAFAILAAAHQGEQSSLF
jgi:hypothetical protein